jgi:hypothetical protein
LLIIQPLNFRGYTNIDLLLVTLGIAYIGGNNPMDKRYPSENNSAFVNTKGGNILIK